MKNEEQIREEIRRVLNLILDEEYNNIIKEKENDKTRLSSQNMGEIIEGLLSPKKDIEEGKNNSPKE